MEDLPHGIIEEPKFGLGKDAVNHLAEARKWTLFQGSEIFENAL